jgi:hypothetical protein
VGKDACQSAIENRKLTIVSESIVNASMKVCLAIVGLASAAAFAPTPASWVERYYSRVAYPAIQHVLTPLANQTSLALFDVLLIGSILASLAWWISRLARATRGHRLRTCLALTAQTTGLAAGAYLVFLGMWGLNYRREPLTEKMRIDRQRVTPEALLALAETSVASVNGLYETANRTDWPGLAQVPERLAPAFERTQQRLAPAPTAVMGRPKVTWLSFYFRRAGVDGMINPFLLEILINGNVLPFERALIVAHEAAHLAGYADEGEASFVGWLTCLAGDEQAQYSAWLFLLPQTVRYVSEEEQRTVFARLEPGPRADLTAVSARLAEAVPVVSRNARRAYDRFLKANRVERGIASYGTVVDLILGTEDWK